MDKSSDQRKKGLVAVTRLLLIFCLSISSATTFSWARAPLLVVADIDDTLKISHILSRGGDQWDQFQQIFIETDAFSGSRTLLKALDQGGAQIYYVSAAPKIAASLQKNFLKKNSFPQRHHLIVRPSPNTDTYAYKVSVISSLIKTHPGFEVVLLGDNAEKDVAAYEEVSKSKSGAHITTFIHELYVGKPAAPVASKQIAFLTFAEVSAYLEDMGILNRSTTQTIETETLSDLSSRNRRELTVPKFTELKKEDLERLESRLPYPMRELFDQLEHALLHKGHDLSNQN